VDVDKETLIKHLKRNGYLTSDIVEEAIRNVPREDFIPHSLKKHAYEDRPLSIGSGQTISAPHMVALMTETLELVPNHCVLEIGTGSGYHAAVVAQLVPQGHVYTIERIPPLANQARKVIEKLNIENISVVISDGSLGHLKNAPYDRIYATCATPSIPQSLIHQLGSPGKMLIPVGGTYCNLILLEKNQRIKRTNLIHCAFVPMIGSEGHHV
jgi:protein-L-isoaspartate(D-aspartate) O-methyltransferase